MNKPQPIPRAFKEASNSAAWIDQSTSATKALLFDENGSVVDRESIGHRQFYPRPGWVEHDAEQIHQNTVRSLALVCGRNRNLPDRVICLSLTNQKETVVVFDRDCRSFPRSGLCYRGCSGWADSGR